MPASAKPLAAPPRTASGKPSPRASRNAADFRIVGIGASAGGLEAYTELLRNFTSTEKLAYILVQHLDPTHRSLLTELLGKSTSLRVREVTDGMPAAPDEIVVIPPNCDLTIEKGILRLAVRSKNGGPARTIDHFLRSLAADQGENAIAIILSGAGSDGAEGLRAIKEAGGVTFAQDETTAKYDSMPRSATATGCVDFVLPPEKIAQELARLVRRPAGLRQRSAANVRRRGGASARENVRPFGDDGTDGVAMPEAPEDSHLRKIFHLLRSRTGVDFGHYRINTVRRRLARRLAVTKSANLDVYARFLARNPAEIDALHQDLLINVTNFFRNPGVFEALKRKVFPRLVQNRDPAEPIRVWVAGCSTGQEAYSIAMAWVEYSQQAGPEVAIQIFASDVNPAVLEFARAGRYTAAQVESLTKERLKRFFVPDGETYRVQKAIRDRIVFAQQNLLTHPPFTRVDLITCRNVLIYLEPALQQKIIPTFHYALRPGGYLMLGTSESVGQFSQLFDSREKKLKIFARKSAPSWVRLERPATSALRSLPLPAAPRNGDEFNLLDAQREADRLTLSKYAPAGVMIDEDGQILQFRGDVRRYLELPKSRASFQLFKMARSGLEFPLRRALQRARKRNAPATESEPRLPGGRGGVEIQVVPLRGVKRSCFLVLFQPTIPAALPVRSGGKAPRGGGARRLADLKQEFARTREHLSSLQEAHDTSMEELQSSNEEVQSANEELQSLNEELETSNEELESANEELTTLNEELSTRNSELRESERRLREQAQLLELAPVLARSPKDRIIFWNAGAERLYGYSKEEAIGQNLHQLLAAKFPEPIEKIQTRLYRDGHWQGEVQYRRKDGKVIAVAAQWVVHYDDQRKARAVLEANADISERLAAEEALRESETFSRTIMDSSPDCIQVLDLEGRIKFTSQEGRRLLDLGEDAHWEDSYWTSFWEGEERIKADDACRAARGGQTVRFQGAGFTASGSQKWWDVAIRPLLGEDRRPQRLLVVSRDISDQKAAADERERLLQQTLAARNEVEVLNTVGRLIAAELDLEKLSQAVTDAATNLSGAEFGALFHMTGDEHGQRYSLFTFSGPSQAALARLPLPKGEQVASPLFDRKEPVRSDDLLADPRFHQLSLDHEVVAGIPSVRSYLAVPVISRAGHVLGGLMFGHSRPGSFGDREERLVTGLAAQASIAMDNARLFDQMERRVEERTLRLRETIAELQAFSYTVSHDLRAPLRAMQSYAQVLKLDHGHELQGDARHYLERIERAGLRLDRLIQDVLTYSRMSQAAPPLKLVDLDRLIREILDQYPMLQEVEGAVRVDGPLPEVLAEESLATQVLSNLLGNAVKFVPPGRSPRIVIRAELSPAFTRIWVEDNGLGIPTNDLERIFKMFERVAHDREYEGTGIGLAIVRRAMERMGGRVGVVSKVGEGSRFWLDFQAR